MKVFCTPGEPSPRQKCMRRQPDAEVRFPCANCGEPLNGPGAVARGPDTAWHGQCRSCHALVADQLELAEDQPGGAKIQIYRCRGCGELRACRKGWLTRCHICLDERSTGPIVTAAGKEFLAGLRGDPGLAGRARQLLRLADDEEIPLRGAVEACSSLALASELRRLDRPGWTIIAADVCGLPWTGARSWYTSHGTWARHDACGTVAKLRPGSVDCPACGPEPGSRTHQARSERSLSAVSRPQQTMAEVRRRRRAPGTRAPGAGGQRSSKSSALRSRRSSSPRPSSSNYTVTPRSGG